MLVRDPAGELLSRDAFADYCEPLNMPLLGGTVESLWSRNERSAGIRFFVNNRYSADTVRMRWGASFPKGIYIRRAAYQLAIPAELEPQVRIDGEWHALADGWSAAQWPQAVRWQKDGAVAEVLLEPQAVNALAGAGGKNDLCGADKGHACTTGRASARAVARTEWNPGGENSFCPFAMLQLSLEVDVVAELGRFSMDATLRLGQGSRTV